MTHQSATISSCLGFAGLLGLWLLCWCGVPELPAQERKRWDEPVNLSALNSEDDDFAPSWSRAEQVLYFNSMVSGFSQFFTARYDRKDEKADLRTRLAGREIVKTSLNTPRNNQSFITFANDGSVYFSSYRQTKRRPYLNIMQAARQNALWQQPEPVAALNTDNFNAHPALSPSGTTMVFASNRPGGRGETDLWIATKDERGEWQPPVNMGDVLNSAEQEISPFFASEDSLYFASNGFGGKGGFEIFLTTRSGSKWQAPVPVTELNSEFDDVDFTMLPGNVGVFASNRSGGRGGFDLYAARLQTFSLASLALEYKVVAQTSFLALEEFSTTDLLPLLPCLFFAENAATLPPELKQRTKDEVQQYSPTAARPDVLGVYAELLNIVGKRLREYENAALILTPYITEASSSKQLDLAKARVETLRTYLANVWGVQRSRLISGTPRNIADMLPTAQTQGSRSALRTTMLSSNERSRCVELACTDPRVLAPVQIGSVTTQSKVQRLETYLDVRPREFLRSWHFAATTGTSAQDTLLVSEGSTLPHTLTIQLSPELLNRIEGEMRLTLVGTDSLGRKGKGELLVSVYRLPIKQKREQAMSDKLIERTRIVLLDESQTELTAEQRELLRGIASSLTGSSTTRANVTISGYGATELRNNGSQIERFMMLVSEEFKKQGITISTELLGDNEALASATPQERLYARCVFITVERPLAAQEKR